MHLMDVVMLLLVLLVLLLLLLLLLLVVVAAVREVRLLSVGLVRVTCLAVAVVRLGGVGGGMHQAAADEPLGDVEVGGEGRAAKRFLRAAALGRSESCVGSVDVGLNVLCVAGCEHGGREVCAGQQLVAVLHVLRQPVVATGT